MSPRRLTREDGTTLAVAVEGAGPTALLLHGFTLSSAMWTENGVAPALAGRFRVVAPDLRGHGDSDRPADPAAYGRRMVADIGAVLDAEGAERAHLVGFSLGAELALAFAAGAPGRAASLTLIGSGWSDAEVLEFYGMFDAYARDGGVPGTEAEIAALSAVAASVGEVVDLPRDAVAAVACPVRGIVGERDPERRYLERLIGTAPDYALEVIAGEDHEGSWRHPSLPGRIGRILDAAA